MEYFLDILEKVGPDLAEVAYFLSSSFNVPKNICLLNSKDRDSVCLSELKQVFRGTMRNHRTCSENHKSHDDSSFKSLQIALNSRDGTYRLVREHFYQRKPVYATEQKGHCDIYLTTLTSSLRIASSKVQVWGEKSLFLFVFNNFSQLCVTKSALPDMNSQFWKLPVISLSGGIRLALLRVTRVWCAGHHKPLYSDFRKMGFNRILRLQN